jgi:4'-phosphopantetheinyl transferase
VVTAVSAHVASIGNGLAAAPGWLTQTVADVPPGDGWLGPVERSVLGGLRVDARRVAWRLGRWTAKRALGVSLEVGVDRLEVLAADDGAPEAWLDGERLPRSISLSHRGDRALAVVAAPRHTVGCDLELVEPRSGAFIREWLSPSEQRLVLNSEDGGQPLLANLIWAAKEAAAKVRREGLRLDVRRAVVTPDDFESGSGAWRRMHVDWREPAAATGGWWRTETDWVMVIAGEPTPAAPRQL